MAKLPKFNYRLPRFGLLVGSLLIVTLLTALSGLWHYQYEVAHQSPAASLLGAKARETVQNSPGVTAKAVISGAVAGNNNSPNQSSGSISSHQTLGNYTKPGTGTAPSTTGSVGNQSITATPQSPAIVTLTLSINGHSKGSVNLTTGSNQCDVLTQALTNGLINNLDMRYSSEYQTEAVYVIEGIGDPGAVWWTYKVNGVAPTYGCAYVKAHNGDSVNWQYVKN